jgi:CBS domain-containing protein
MKSIKTIMSCRETFSVELKSSVAEAARLMAERGIGAVPVIDDGRLAGIFSERDVLNRVVAAGRDPAVTPVAEVMSAELVVADVTENYDICLSRMQQAHVRHLIVLDKGTLAGIVSFRDLLAADLDEKAEAITLLNAYVHYIPADLQQQKVRT